MVHISLGPQVYCVMTRANHTNQSQTPTGDNVISVYHSHMQPYNSVIVEILFCLTFKFWFGTSSLLVFSPLINELDKERKENLTPQNQKATLLLDPLYPNAPL